MEIGISRVLVCSDNLVRVLELNGFTVLSEQDARLEALKKPSEAGSPFGLYPVPDASFFCGYTLSHEQRMPFYQRKKNGKRW